MSYTNDKQQYDRQSTDIYIW